MPTGDLGDVLQMLGEGQTVEHQDGLHDVVVDDVALFGRQRAAGDAQVVQFATVEFVLRHFQLEAPAIVWRDHLLVGALDQMVEAVSEQRLLHRQAAGGRVLQALGFLPGNAQAIVQCA